MPCLHYRLGRLYAFTASVADARRNWNTPRLSSDKVLRDLANKALAELK